MKQDSYYGNDKPETVSFLEFGSIDLSKKKKVIWGYRQDQKAYDYYMFARYADDLFLFRKFVEAKNFSIQELNTCILASAHDKIMDYIFKYAGVVLALKNDAQKRICESGSSLLGLIDECIALDYVFANGDNVEKIKCGKYLGSDISEMMNLGAKAFHSECDFKFSTAETVDKLLTGIRGETIGLFYGLSVSLRYALREAKDLITVGNNSELAIFNRISLARGGNMCSIAGTGKYVYIMSLPEYVDMMQANGLKAKFCTANMQHEKDGKDTLRASIVMSKDVGRVDEFVGLYQDLTNKAKDISNVVEGEWLDIRELL